MAVEFEVETGTASATGTSYTSVADFLQYWENRDSTIHTALSALSTDNQNRLLNRATAHIDNNYDFQGRVKSSSQALSFPRVDIYDKNNYAVSSSTIPEDLQNAVSEIARELYRVDTENGEYTNANQQGQGIKSKSIGVMSITYAGNAQGNGSTFKDYPEATRYLLPYLERGIRV